MSALRCLLLLCLFAMLAACKREGDGAGEMSMRVYQVPAERAQAVVVSINQALSMNRAPDSKAPLLGQASLGGNGQVIVLAADSLHPSIEKSLQDIMASQPIGADARGQLRLRFWSVDMLPGAENDSPGLATIESALAELRKNAGAVHFALRDHMESVSTDVPSPGGGQPRRSWDSVRVGTTNEPVRQVLTYSIDSRNGVHSLELQFSDANHPGPSQPGEALGIYTATTVTLGQTLVLASQPVMPIAEGAPGATRYYILRVDAVDAG